jgi:hypothetical protein
MVMDLRAVAASLGGEGGSCVAVVDPALDIGTLHRFLVKHRAPGVRRVSTAADSGASAGGFASVRARRRGVRLCSAGLGWEFEVRSGRPFGVVHWCSAGVRKGA